MNFITTTFLPCAWHRLRLLEGESAGYPAESRTPPPPPSPAKAHLSQPLRNLEGAHILSCVSPLVRPTCGTCAKFKCARDVIGLW
ncbi:unnamed protein product, partial [Iphiclides podalirius]